MAKRKRQDPYAWFRDMSKDDQREHLLDVASMCIDAANVPFARKVEIYLGVTDDMQRDRAIAIRRRWDKENSQ